MAPRFLAGWSSSLQALGVAFGDLVRAELDALGEDLSHSGRRLGSALLLLAGALFALFWALGLAVYLAVEVAHLWLSRWAAAAVVLAVVLLLLSLLALVGWRRLQSLESPAVTFRRRWQGHRRWWLDQFPAADESADRQGDVALGEEPGEPD
jgi:uncharacterized membrane protein YqjE